VATTRTCTPTLDIERDQKSSTMHKQRRHCARTPVQHDRAIFRSKFIHWDFETHANNLPEDCKNEGHRRCCPRLVAEPRCAESATFGSASRHQYVNVPASDPWQHPRGRGGQGYGSPFVVKEIFEGLQLKLLLGSSTGSKNSTMHR
jgi:hypothetical protein